MKVDDEKGDGLGMGEDEEYESDEESSLWEGMERKGRKTRRARRSEGMGTCGRRRCVTLRGPSFLHEMGVGNALSVLLRDAGTKGRFYISTHTSMSFLYAQRQVIKIRARDI
jgi:hypothetical protein